MSGSVARTVVPFKNCTVPVGVPVAGLMGATVAVKSTFWPTTGDVVDGDRVVVVVAVAATGTETAGDVAPLWKLVSPP